MGKAPDSGQQSRLENHDPGTLTVYGDDIFTKLGIIDFLCEGDGRLY